MNAGDSIWFTKSGKCPEKIAKYSISDTITSARLAEVVTCGWLAGDTEQQLHRPLVTYPKFWVRSGWVGAAAAFLAQDTEAGSATRALVIVSGLPYGVSVPRK